VLIATPLYLYESYKERHEERFLKWDRVMSGVMTCVCEVAVVREQGISFRARIRQKGEKERGQTSYEIELFLDNFSEFSFRDAILESIRYVGT
jgi:hypothetical protein